MKKQISAFLILIFLIGAASQVLAQLKPQTLEVTPAVAKYNEAELARQNKDLEKALRLYQEAFEIDPEYLAAHRAFINNTRVLVQSQAEVERKNGTVITEDLFLKANKQLQVFYQKKIAEKPNVAAFYFSLGNSIGSFDVPNSEVAMKRALELNPKLVEAYEYLGSLSFRVFRLVDNRNYQKLAYEVDSASPQRFYRYAIAELDVNETNGRKLLRELAERFPKNDFAIFALGTLADSFDNEREKTKILEEMKTRFAGSKGGSFPFKMSGLFNIYSRTDMPKALQLADQMFKQIPDSKEWKANLEYAQNIIEARKLLQTNKLDETFTLLENTKPFTNVLDVSEFTILKAKAANDNTKAYNILLESLIKIPNAKTEKALTEYGKKLGKSAKTVDDDLWQARVAQSKPFKDFNLAVFPLEQKKQLSLKDLKNKVVLANFWFPGCGPCRYELKHFEAMIKKYRSKGFEIISLNIVPNEDSEIAPFMKNSGYSIVPVQTPGVNWARENYGVSLAPTNFLLDGEGRILFQSIIRDEESAKIFELQIQTLLARLKK